MKEEVEFPMILKFIRMPMDLITEIAKVQKDKSYNGFAETTRELCLLAIHVLKIKSEIKDPELVEKLKSFKNKDLLIEYIFKEMPEHERQALKLALEYSAN